MSKEVVRLLRNSWEITVQVDQRIYLQLVAGDTFYEVVPLTFAME